jgi:hypothetical protein
MSQNVDLATLLDDPDVTLIGVATLVRSEPAPDLESILAKHQINYFNGTGVRCRCDNLIRTNREYREHLAAVVAPAAQSFLAPAPLNDPKLSELERRAKNELERAGRVPFGNITSGVTVDPAELLNLIARVRAATPNRETKP